MTTSIAACLHAFKLMHPGKHVWNYTLHKRHGELCIEGCGLWQHCSALIHTFSQVAKISAQHDHHHCLIPHIAQSCGYQKSSLIQTHTAFVLASSQKIPNIPFPTKFAVHLQGTLATWCNGILLMLLLCFPHFSRICEFRITLASIYIKILKCKQLLMVTTKYVVNFLMHASMHESSTNMCMILFIILFLCNCCLEEEIRFKIYLRSKISYYYSIECMQSQSFVSVCKT